MRHSYEVAGVEITRYKTGYKLQEHDTNPWHDDNRDWIYPRDFDSLVSQVGSSFVVKKTYYEISVNPIGEGAGLHSSGIEFLQNGGGESDFEPLFEELVAEFDLVFKRYGEEIRIEEKENVKINDLTLLTPIDECDRITFIGLFHFWSDPGDGREREPDAGIDFVCRVNPDKLKLLKE